MATYESMHESPARVPGSAGRKGPAVGVREIVIVDGACDHYADFVQAAQAGEVRLHFCVDGTSAIRLSRRFRADAWLVAAELPDMSGFDLLEMLVANVLQANVDPQRGGSPRRARQSQRQTRSTLKQERPPKADRPRRCDRCRATCRGRGRTTRAARAGTLRAEGCLQTRSAHC